MRIKESLQLDSMITERALSLGREGNRDRMVKKAKVLEALIRCQEELDEIYMDEEEEPMGPNIGDINVTMQGPGKGRGGPGTASNAPFRPFDPGDLGREVAREIKNAVK